MIEDLDNTGLKEVLFYSIVDEFLIYKHSKKFISTLFSHPPGEWSDVNKIFRDNGFIFGSEDLNVNVSWLKDIDGSDSPYRMLVFFESENMFSQVVVFNVNTLD